MSPETKLKVAKLSELTIGQLAAKYEKLFGEKCRFRNRRYVHRRIAWKLQADDEGGLSEQARIISINCHGCSENFIGVSG